MQKPVENDIVVEGHLLHYYHILHHGEKKKTLVFLHGWGSNSTLWFSSTHMLAQHGYELIYFDLPGFGKSQSPKTPFHLDDYAHITSEFMRKCEVQNAILIGHSFGGKTAIRIASKKMVKLDGLILVASSGLPHTSFTTQTKIRIARTVKPIMNLPFMRGIRTQLLRLSGSDDYVATLGLRETFINIISEHIEFELPKIEVKSLILWGRDDDNSYTPVSDATVFLHLIKEAEAHIIEKAGHYSFLDAPEEFCETVLTFLNKNNGKN